MIRFSNDLFMRDAINHAEQLILKFAFYFKV